MRANQPSPTDWWSSKDQGQPDRRETIVMVRWALIIACAYLVLFSEGSAGGHGLGLLVIATFLTSNLAVGRLSPETIDTNRFSIGLALLDSVLIATSLYVAGQLVVELLVLCLGVLVLAIAGLRLGVVAAVTLAMTGVYLFIVWLPGGESLWRSSMLLRVPFLLCTALTYSWMTEPAPLPLAGALTDSLSAQVEAIRRCHAALSESSLAAARAALDEIATKNQEMQAKVAGAQQSASPLPRSPSVARSAA